jgi:Mn-containing catalase
VHKLLGGACGEMTFAMRYLFQGWNCRMSASAKT